MVGLVTLGRGDARPGDLAAPGCARAAMRRGHSWMAWVPTGVASAWGLAAVGFLLYWRRRGWRFALGITWLGLALSAGLAMLLAAAQLLPVVEFSQQTGAPPRGRTASTGSASSRSGWWSCSGPTSWASISEGNTHWRDALKTAGSPAGDLGALDVPGRDDPDAGPGLRCRYGEARRGASG